MKIKRLNHLFMLLFVALVGGIIFQGCQKAEIASVNSEPNQQNLSFSPSENNSLEINSETYQVPVEYNTIKNAMIPIIELQLQLAGEGNMTTEEINSLIKERYEYNSSDLACLPCSSFEINENISVDENWNQLTLNSSISELQQTYLERESDILDNSITVSDYFNSLQLLSDDVSLDNNLSAVEKELLIIFMMVEKAHVEIVYELSNQQRGPCWDCIWKNKSNRKEIFGQFSRLTKFFTATCIAAGITAMIVAATASGGTLTPAAFAALPLWIAKCVGTFMGVEIINDILSLCGSACF